MIRTALVFFGTVDLNNVAFAMLEGMRLATILIVFGTFNAVTDPFGVVRMAPSRFHEPALAAALALSIAPRTIASAQRVREAQTLRGLHTSGIRALPRSRSDPRDRDGGRGWRVSYGSLYPSLRRLEKEGAVESVPSDEERGGRRRTSTA